MNTSTLKRYAELSFQIKQLEAMKDVIYQEAIYEMMALGDGNIAFDCGKVSLSHSAKWEYPEEVLALKEQLKAKELEAKQFGTAIETKTTILKFTANKI